MKKSLNTILSNKVLLYIVFALSILQWIYLLMSNRFDLIIIFGLISFVLKHYHHSMIVILGIPLTIIGLRMAITKEGFEGETENGSGSGSGKPKKEKKTGSGSGSGTGSSVEDDNQQTDEQEQQEEQDESGVNHSQDSEHDLQSNQINYASTLSKNIESYRETLGSDGFAKMTQDTQTLLQQQEQLGNAMKQFAPLLGQMTPFLEKANGLLNNMDVKQINNVANMFKSQ